MEIITDEGVKVPNSVIISGLTKSVADNEIQSYLESHGSINRVIYIDKPDSEFHNNAIVEFTFGTAMQTLSPLLPFDYRSPTSPDVTFHVHALVSVFSPTAAQSTTKGYISSPS